METSSPVVALTFDDGPAPGFTEEILEILGEEGVSATFFVTGQALEENVSEARRIVAEGHELGNRSYSHTRMLGRSYSFVREEVERTDVLHVMTESRAETIQAVPAVVEGLRSRGYRFVTVSELLALEE